VISATGVWSAVAFLLCAMSAGAAPPVLDSFFPPGAERGTTVEVSASGKFEKWPVKVWTDSAGLRFESLEKNGKLTAHVAADTPPGPHLVRVYTADGASALRCFVVGDQLEMPEAEPNDELAKGQVVKDLPVTINGQLAKNGDVDCYAVQLSAGQCLVASVQGRRIGSPIDPMLHLLAEDGTQVAFVHDGLGLDPLLVYRAQRSGRFTIRVSAFAFPPAAEVKFAGGKDAVYRLSLTTGPYVRAVSPSGVTRGQKASLRPIGWNLNSTAIEVDATKVAADVDHVFVPVPGGEGRMRIEVGDGAEFDEPANPQQPLSKLTPPVNVTGTIAAPAEEDRIQFMAKKGERLEFLVRTVSVGSALDAVVRIQDGAGKTLATGDGGTAGDAKLAWSAPNEGVYRATIADLFHNGGPEYRYRLEIKRPVAELRATVENDAYALAPGKGVTMKVSIARKNDYAVPLVAVVTGLPAGVTATSAEIGPKAGGDVSLVLSAAADAKPASGPIHVMLLGTDVARPGAMAATVDLRKDVDKPGGQALIDRTAEVWLTVSPTAEAGPAKAKE
jgi:hypothetical protein